MTARRVRSLVAMLAAVAVFSSGCFTYAAYVHETEHPDTRPWWCHSSGDGGHHVEPFYAGQTKGMLSWDDCTKVSAAFDLAIDYASEWTTLGDAEAAGFSILAPYATGMGTHHIMLNGWDPSQGFDPDDPALPGTAVDDVFEAGRPEFLMYDGTSADAELVGFAWFVKTDPTTPPEGFAGDNDWWHRHPTLCHRVSDGLIVRDGPCDGIAGAVDVDWSSYWMTHAWILDGWQTTADVFTNHHPCLLSGGPAADDDPCWDEAANGGGHGGH